VAEKLGHSLTSMDHYAPLPTADARPTRKRARTTHSLRPKGGELSDEYAAAGCAYSFTPDCADLIMDNLDDWAAFHLANN
jgi:hypothetical protein